MKILLHTCAVWVVLLAGVAAAGVEPQVSLVTGKAVGKLAVAGRLDVDLRFA